MTWCAKNWAAKMTIKAKMTRKGKNKNKLKTYARLTETSMQELVIDYANDVRNEADDALHRHQSKNLDKPTKRGSVIHYPSLPDNPPNTDQGHLASTIGIDLDANKLGATISVTANYAAVLEFGNKDGTLQPRPFLGPANDLAMTNYKRNRKRKLRARI